MDAEAVVGVIGGSGLYSLLVDAETLEVPTPYGHTSSPVTVGMLGGKRVAFLARHGVKHTLAPHRVPYRANIWALASLGVKTVVSSSAVGGLREEYAPGRFVVPEQYLDFTRGRDNTFFDGGSRVEHLAAPDPFDETLRQIAINALLPEEVPMRGTVAVIEGPRFASRAESQMYRNLGGDIINMTLLPEVPLALELGLGVVNISFVTDYDSIVPRDDADAVSAGLVFERLAAAQPVIRRTIERVVTLIPDGYQADTGVPADAVAQVLDWRD